MVVGLGEVVQFLFYTRPRPSGTPSTRGLADNFDHPSALTGHSPFVGEFGWSWVRLCNSSNRPLRRFATPLLTQERSGRGHPL